MIIIGWIIPKEMGYPFCAWGLIITCPHCGETFVVPVSKCKFKKSNKMEFSVRCAHCRKKIKPTEYRELNRSTFEGFKMLFEAPEAFRRNKENLHLCFVDLDIGDYFIFERTIYEVIDDKNAINILTNEIRYFSYDKKVDYITD